MRAHWLVLIWGLLFAAGAQAQLSLTSFTWKQNGLADLDFIYQGRNARLRDIRLEEDKEASFSDKNGTISATMKFTGRQEPFVIIAFTFANDETGYIFLEEQIQGTWRSMRDEPIRSRKLDLMKDFTEVMAAFKRVTNFGTAESMRKTVEYFQKYPDKRLQDLFDSLERGDSFVLAVAKPNVQPGRDGGGGIPGQNRGGELAGRIVDPSAEVQESGPAPTPNSGGGYDPRGVPNPQDPYGGQRYQTQEDWIRQQQIARQQQWARQQQQQQQQQQMYPPGFWGGQQRPPQNVPQQRYSPQYPQYPQQQMDPFGGFFNNIFGGR